MSVFTQLRIKENQIKLTISLVLALAFLYLFSPFTVPILFSVIFAFALEPTIASISHKKISRLRYTCISLVLVALLVVSAPLALISVLSYSEIHLISGAGIDQSRVYQSFLNFRELLISSLESLSTEFKLQSMFRSATVVDHGINQISNYLSSVIPVFVANLPSLAFSFLVFNVLLFIFLFRARSIKVLYLKTHALRYTELNFIIYSLQSSCRAALISTLLTGFMHALLFTAASILFHVGEPVLVFPITFLFSFLPVIGTLPVTLALAGYAFLNHHSGSALGVLAIAFLSSVLDYWVRVKFMVDESKRIHPAFSFIGLIGAFIHFGFAGLLYGPLCISLAAMMIPQFLFSSPAQKVLASSPAVKWDDHEKDSGIDPAILTKNFENLEKRPWIN